MRIKITYRILQRFRNSLILFLIAVTGMLNAQQDAHYSQYIFNGLVLNPAYAGSRGNISGSLYYRKQWWGMEGAPTTQSFSVHMPDRSGRYGFGMALSNDQIGYINQQWVNLCYAFRWKLGPGNIALGLQGGMMNYRINWDQAQLYTSNDPVIPFIQQNFRLPTVGTGVFYNTEYFFVGLSVPHLLNSSIAKQKINASDFARIYRHYYFTAGYVFGRVSEFKFRPSVLLKYSENAPLQADFNLAVFYRDVLWLGAGYRTFDSMVFFAEFVVKNQLRIGYAFDYTISGLRTYNSGTHEFMLGYELHSKKTRYKSPRYF